MVVNFDLERMFGAGVLLWRKLRDRANAERNAADQMFLAGPVFCVNLLFVHNQPSHVKDIEMLRGFCELGRHHVWLHNFICEQCPKHLPWRPSRLGIL